MILKDEALALRIYPFGNTSQIVVWLSRTHGKLATLAKGSQRERSPFLGQFDLFYTCEILFYAREHRNLYILKECTPLEWRPSLRTDWRACAAASYAAGALDRAMPFGPAPGELYELLTHTLDHLAARTPGPAFLPRFELQLLRELGLAPRWEACAKCRAGFGAGAGARMDIAHGAVLCPACAKDRGMVVSPAAVQALRRMQADVATAGLSGPVFREIRTLLGGLLEHHAEFASGPREIAFEVLAAR